MRVAIPESDGQVERIADTATSLMLIDLRDGVRGDQFRTPLRNRSMRDHARELAAMKINVLLCDEISHALKSLIAEYGIEVRPAHRGNVETVIDRFVDEYRSSTRPSQERSLQLDAVS
jgi:predicted Fe-Mo cluster-binding NifX family protein